MNTFLPSFVNARMSERLRQRNKESRDTRDAVVLLFNVRLCSDNSWPAGVPMHENDLYKKKNRALLCW